MTRTPAHVGAAAAAVAILFPTLVACGGDVGDTGDDCGGDCTLTDAEAWDKLAEHEDPYASEQSIQASCMDNAAEERGEAVQITTGLCNHVAYGQPLQYDMEPGDTVQITFWYDALRADEPSEAHIALGIEDLVIWERWIEIPSSDGMGKAVETLDEELLAGDIAWIHVHDAGDNTYSFANWKLVDE